MLAECVYLMKTQWPIGSFDWMFPTVGQVISRKLQYRIVAERVLKSAFTTRLQHTRQFPPRRVKLQMM